LTNKSARIITQIELTGACFLDIKKSSLQTGIIPENWKKSTIVPHINILPAYEKVLESAVKTEFMNYLERNKILIDEQSGFQSTHSCETSLDVIYMEKDVRGQ
jgi:hypothetical protein